MKYVVATAFCLALLLGAWSNVPIALIHAQSATSSDPVIVAFGDSLTFGIGSTAGNDYVSLLSRWSTLTIRNEGVSGDTTADALARVEEDVLSRNPDVVIVFLGGNDILQSVPLDTTIANLRTIINQITSSGARVILVGSHASVFDTTRENRFQQLASETKVRYISNALRGILGNPKLLSDPVHPNNAGYLILADRLWLGLSRELNLLTPPPPLRVACEVTPEAALTGNAVEWRAYTWGGEQPGAYRYQWSGDNLSASGEFVAARYESAGTKRASVSVTSGTETRSVECRNNVIITAPPLVGSCDVSLGINRLADDDRNEVFADWRATARGGTGSYTFSWNGSDGLSGTEQIIRNEYVTPGIKEGSVAIISGDQTIDLTCAIQVRGTMIAASSTTPLYGGCNVSTGNYSIDQDVRWSATARGGSSGTTTTYLWEDSSALDGETERTVSVEYSTPGRKEGTVTVTRGEEDFEATCSVVLASSPVTGGGGTGGGSGCFIATAAYGSALEPHVETLRTFRDQYLLTSVAGRVIVDTYYRISPPIANVIRTKEAVKAVVRGLLAPLVYLADLVVE